MVTDPALVGSATDLRGLLNRVEQALDRVPGLSVPVSSIGSGQAWTGPAARTFHSEQLSPLATALTAAKRQVISDLGEALTHAPSAADPSHGHQPG